MTAYDSDKQAQQYRCNEEDASLLRDQINKLSYLCISPPILCETDNKIAKATQHESHILTWKPFITSDLKDQPRVMSSFSLGTVLNATLMS